MKSWEWNRMQRTFESSKQLIVRIDVIKKAYRKLALKWHPGNYVLRDVYKRQLKTISTELESRMP